MTLSSTLKGGNDERDSLFQLREGVLDVRHIESLCVQYAREAGHVEVGKRVALIASVAFR